jgi:hypothetical protein
LKVLFLFHLFEIEGEQSDDPSGSDGVECFTVLRKNYDYDIVLEL